MLLDRTVERHDLRKDDVVTERTDDLGEIPAHEHVGHRSPRLLG